MVAALPPRSRVPWDSREAGLSDSEREPAWPNFPNGGRQALGTRKVTPAAEALGDVAGAGESIPQHVCWWRVGIREVLHKDSLAARQLSVPRPVRLSSIEVVCCGAEPL